MTGTQHITIFHICSSNESESKGIIADKNLLQVCSTDEIESKSVHKIINTNKVKYAIDETEYEEPLVTYNPVINEQIDFNLFECGKNFLNSLDATC